MLFTQDFILCKLKTFTFIDVIKNELTKAEEAVKALEYFRHWDGMNGEVWYSRKEAASIIGTTIETIRNWERNGLVKSLKREKKCAYCQRELNLMRLIYILLSSGFTIQKIYESLSFLRKSDNQKAVTALCKPYDYIISR